MPTMPEANLSVDPQRSLAVDTAAGGSAESGRSGERGISLLNLRGATAQFQVAGLGTRSVADRVLARNNEALLARYTAEYREPSIWLWRRVVGGAFAFIVVTLLWYLIKMPSGLISDTALPTQTQVATAFNEVRSQGFAGSSLSHHVGISLFRLTLGLGFGSMFGVALGLLVGAAPMVRTIVDPIASFFRMVPGLAVGPLLLVWFGAGERATIGVVAFTVMWATMGSASQARVGDLRGTATDLPLEVIAGMRSALLLAWATVLAIETVVASSGLGAMIWFAQGRTDVVIFGICVAGLLGFLLDTGIRATEYFLASGPTSA
jgi:ABC-type nitrate/sulfonate/bicarbonate transport system permease component